MKLFALPVSLALALVGLQLLSTQPAEARGRRHHMRDQYAQQQAFYANPGTYSGYGAACNMPMNSAYAQGSFPPGLARQMYGNPNAYYGNSTSAGYGYGNPGFLRGLLGY